MRVRRLIRSAVLVAMTMAAITPAASQDANTLASSDPGKGPISLGSGPTRVMLSLPQKVGEERSLGARLRGVPVTQGVYLQLKNFRTDKPPGVTYNVYLNLPADAVAAGTSDPHYIGTLNLLGPRSPVINITDRIKQLPASSTLDERATVTVIPAGTPQEGARVTIDRVLLLAE